jgi:hypothetical protein
MVEEVKAEVAMAEEAMEEDIMAAGIMEGIITAAIIMAVPAFMGVRILGSPFIIPTGITLITATPIPIPTPIPRSLRTRSRYILIRPRILIGITARIPRGITLM